MSYTRLRYHAITATHERRPMLTPEVEAIVYATLRRVMDDEGGRVLAVGGVEDHVHLVLALRPTHALADVMRVLKSASARAAHRAGHEAFRWQTGYWASTVSPRHVSRVQRYVARQKEHHGTGTTDAACEASA